MQREFVPIEAFLTQPATQQWLQEQLTAIRQQLTAPIGKVKEIIDVPETRLRYWESRHLLAPARAAQKPQKGKRGAGQRYYGIEQLARALLINKLLEDKRYSLDAIASFMQREETFIERLIAANQLVQRPEAGLPQTVMERVSAAEAALMWEFFLPRALYAVLSLLIERAFTGDARLYLPIRAAGAPILLPQISSPADLPKLGQVLLGWRESNRAFAALAMAAPPPEPTERFEVLSLEDVLPEDTAILPVGAHIALTPPFARILRRDEKLKPASISARRVAARLLKFLQDRAAEWQEALKARGETLLYDSPTLTHSALGGPLLNVMAETVIALGSTPAKPWRFCCILLPQDLLEPLMARNLIVRGQSEQSPYQVGETRLSPRQLGLSILAYQSGHMIYRPHVTDEDPAIAWREREEPVSGGSAIAVPIEGEYGKSLGAIYVVSAQPDAFPLESQQLLRIVGRMISEQVMASRGRQLMTENLSDLIEEPQTVESLFKGMQNINQFRRDLANMLESLKTDQPVFDHLSLVAVDISDLSSVALKYGDLAATKNLVREVGERTQEQARLIFTASSGVDCYHAYVDRFYLLLKNFAPDKAGNGLSHHAEELKAQLETLYRINAPRVLPTQTMPPAYLLDLKEIKVRLAEKSYSRDELKRLVDANGVPWVVDHLESGLKAALPR